MCVCLCATSSITEVVFDSQGGRGMMLHCVGSMVPKNTPSCSEAVELSTLVHHSCWILPLSVYEGNRLQAADHRIQAAGYRQQTAGYRPQAKDYRLQGTGYRLQATGNRLQTAGYRVQATDCRVQATDCRVQATGSQMAKR